MRWVPSSCAHRSLGVPPDATSVNVTLQGVQERSVVETLASEPLKLDKSTISTQRKRAVPTVMMLIWEHVKEKENKGYSPSEIGSCGKLRKKGKTLQHRQNTTSLVEQPLEISSWMKTTPSLHPSSIQNSLRYWPYHMKTRQKRKTKCGS